MAAPMWTGFLENFVINQQISGVLDISSAIINGSLRLLELIELLGVYLTDNDKEKRSRGTQLLSEVLHRLPQDLLQQQEVEVLVSFYCDRLKDHHSIIPSVLTGLNALSTYKNVGDGCAEKIADTILKEVQVQSMSQSDRRCVYQLLANFLATKLEELKRLGSGFVYGYIQAMDGEKDPRNLVLVFESVQLIIKHFPIRNFAEELFEVTSCYFPIDFAPPPNDPFGVTKDSLVLGLRKCMSATPLFAEYCLPLILEKLTSDLQNSKLDALYTLTSACDTYGVKYLNEYKGSYLSQIQHEIFTAGDEEMESAALGALSAYTKAMENDIAVSGNRQALDEFINDVFKECRHHLCEPELKLVFPSGKMMQAVASVSQAAAHKVLEMVMPLLLEQFHKHHISNHRRNILDIILGFIRVCKNFPHSGGSSPLLPYKDDLKAILRSISHDSDYQLRVTGITGLMGLLAVPSLMTTEETSEIAPVLLLKVISDTDVTVRKESVAGLAFMAMEHRASVKEKVLPQLEKLLDTDKMDVDYDFIKDNEIPKPTVLNLMAAVSVQSEITAQTVPKITSFLADRNQANATCDSNEETVAALECLCAIIKENAKHDSDRHLFLEKTLPDLLNLCVKCSMVRQAGAIMRPKSVELICDIVRNIVFHLDSSQLEELAGKLLQLFQDGDLRVFNSTKEGEFRPLVPTSSPSQTQLIGVLMAVVCALPQKTDISQHTQLLSDLVLMCLDCDHDGTRLSAAKCVGGLLNKYKQGEDLNRHIAKLKEDLNGAISRGERRAFSLWLWITKALVLRAHPGAKEFVSAFLSKLEDEELGELAADGFYIILNEFPDVMTTQLHADIKLMYRQRFFMETLPKLVDGFNTTSTEKKPKYLNALAYLLRFVPRQVLLSELPPLLPLMIQSLHCEDVNLWLSTLNTMYDLMHDAPQILASYVDSLIPQLIQLSKYQANMKVRISSLQCLGMMTTLPLHKVVPYQKTVIKDLGPALDDKKRLVRKEAVQARGEWFLLGK